MPPPIRVFVAAASEAERRDLAARLAAESGCTIVGDVAFAELVMVSPEEWARLAPRPHRAQGSAERPVESLTPREFEVLRLVADGLHNREIAARLGVTEHTVKFHLGAIFGKLGAATRTEAVRKGLRLRMIEI